MLTKEKLFAQLEAMQAPKNSIVLMHTSLKAVGEVAGRGEGLLQMLIEYFTDEGGLFCVPTHTWAFFSDPARFTLDLMKNETCIGVFPTIAAGHPDGVRSQHPTHSMVVFGDRARVNAFVADEVFATTPCDPKGCYGKICDADGYILLVGVGHNRNTFLHCVEEMLNVPNRLSVNANPVTVRQKDGSLVQRRSHGHHAKGIGDVSALYPKYEAAFRHHGHITDGFVGNAPTQLCRAQGMRDVMALIQKRSGGAEVLSDATPLEKSLYC